MSTIAHARLFFFGSRGSGHHLVELAKPGFINMARRTSETPWGDQIDAQLTPKHMAVQGAAELHHLDGWTALAVHDYTGDQRPNSNSVFVIDREATFGEMLAIVATKFGDLSHRIGVIFPAHEQFR